MHFIKEHFLEFELYNFTFTEQKNCLFCRKELFNEKENKCWAIKEEDCVQIKCKDFPHSYHFYNEMKI